MSTDRPSDEFGRPLSGAIDRMERHTERRAARSHGDNPWSRWAARIDKRIEAHSANTRNLATAVGLELAAIRREFAKLEQELADLRSRLETQRALADLAARLDRIEGTPLRQEPADVPSRAHGGKLELIA
jgi:chromosome segregation ATPase